MLEVYRHGARPSTFGSLPHHSHSSSALQPYRPIVNGFGGLGDWTDALLPRSSSSTATSFNVWELSPSKLRTAAVAFTFIVTAGYISLLAAGGLLAILVTGAVVTCCVLLTVLTCATLITLIVTGVPVGYAILRLVMAARSSSGGSGGGGGIKSHPPGLFTGLYGTSGVAEREGDGHPQDGGGGHGRAYGTGGGWSFRGEDEEEE